MVWSNTVPDGTKALNVLDNDMRANAVAIEDAFDEEHQFATGGVQTGRHRFGVGTDGDRTTAMPSPVSGNTWWNTKDFATHAVLVPQTHNGSNWIDGSPYGLLPFLADANIWTGGNAQEYEAVATAGTGPEVWTIDIDVGTAWKGTLTEDSTLDNLTGSTLIAADRHSDVLLQVTQHGATAYDITTFGANLLPAWGAQPTINPVLGSITFIRFAMRSDQKWIYSVEYTT